MQVWGQRVVENPTYEFRNSAIPLVTKVVLDADSTYLHLRCTFKPKGWISFSAETVIKDHNSDKKYTIRSIQGAEFDDNLVTPAEGYQDVVLVFDAIDPSIKALDFDDGGWRIFNVSLDESIDTSAKWESVLPQSLAGSWSDVEGVDGWCYGLFSDFAIIDNKFWDYEKVQRRGASYSLNLKSGDELLTLYVEPRDSLLAIGASKKSLSLYTKESVPYSQQLDESAIDLRPMESGNVFIQGYIDNYSPLVGFSTAMIYADNTILDSSNNEIINIEPNGRFSANLQVDHGGKYYASMGNYDLKIYVIPGDTLTLYYDLNKIMRSQISNEYPFQHAKSMGRHARLHDEATIISEIFTKLTKKSRNYYDECQKEDFDIHKFADKLQKHYTADSTLLETELQKSNLSTLSKELARTNLDVAYFDFGVCPFLYNKELRERVRTTVDGIGISSTDPSNHNPKLFQTLKYIDTSDPTTFFYGCDSYFVNRFEFAPFMPLYFSITNRILFIERLAEAGLIEVTKEEREAMTLVISNDAAYRADEKEKAVAMDSMQKVTFKVLLDKHLDKVDEFYGDTLIVAPFKRQIKAYVENANLYQSPNQGGLLAQVAVSRKWKNTIEGNELSTANALKLKDAAFEFVTDQRIRDVMNRYYDSKFGVTTTEVKSKPIPEGAGKAILEEIIRPYRGSYVMIDFWATTCGPCIAGIKSSHDVRKEYGGKGIEFVFITDDRSSPQASYDKHMSDVVGDKHRITGDDWNKIAALFNINAIPRYILFDANGDVVDDHFGGWHDVEGLFKK